MITVGITGSMACGKTLVAKMFKQKKVQVLDADRIAHRVLYKNTKTYSQVVKAFGKAIFNPDDSISRKKLASVAFKNISSQKRLCAIVHPQMVRLIREKLKFYGRSEKTKILVVDAALLIETGLYKDMDKIILVKSTLKQQIARAVEMKNISSDSVKNRLQFQLPLNKKIKYADYIINNQESIKSVRMQFDKIWKELNK